MHQFLVFMMMFYVDIAAIESIRKDNVHLSRQFYLAFQQSSLAPHLESVIWHSILHVTFTCHVILSLCDIITTL